jgi:transposase
VFVRKKRNKSGVISVQIIDKSSGVYKVLQTIGSSGDELQVNNLVNQGQLWIKHRIGQIELDFDNEKQLLEQLLSGIQQISIAGTGLLLGKIFDEIGFNQIEDSLFRQLVIARLCFPASKLKTTDLLKRYHSIELDEDKIYRYMDKLYNTQKQTVQQISYNHTRKVLDHKISVVFYDVTTLYFEIDNEDTLRKTGFSKEGKHQNPQIVLGLLVSVDGYPLAYEIFEGNKFEGHTMLPVIDAFKVEYNLDKLVIIADSGLLSTANINELVSKGYEFILGARIKNEKKVILKNILSLKLKNGESQVIDKDLPLKLIINYSITRAKKDKANREKGLRKLEKQIKTGKLTKAHINNRGYNKYLKLDGEIEVTIDTNKYNADAAWDGLKGYLTNTNLSKEEIISNYNQLWKIEKAFRISKHDLKIRPIYHRLNRRIESHICLSFTAYKVYKELERQLKEKQSLWSPEKAIDIAKTIYSIKMITPLNKEIVKRTLFLNQEQLELAKLFDI